MYLSDLPYTVKVGYCETEGTEFLARYRRYSLLPTATVAASGQVLWIVVAVSGQVLWKGLRVVTACCGWKGLTKLTGSSPR